MEDKGLLMLARMVLPQDVLDHFIITKIEYVDTKAYDESEMHIHLDEKMEPDLQEDSHFESKGFIAPVEDADARQLATHFDFSGGQIENIARKRTVDYILSGKFASLDEIEDYCRAELLNGKERRTIGFNR